MRVITDQRKYGAKYIQPIAPSSPLDGDTWFDTSVNKLKVYDSTKLVWKWDGQDVLGGGDLGFAINGYNGSSSINRFNFPFDSGISTIVGNSSLPTATPDFNGSCNSSLYGYSFLINYGVNPLTSVDRLTFPFNSGLTTIVSNTTQSRQQSCSLNSSMCGYHCGGSLGDLTTGFSTIDSLNFAFDTSPCSNVGNLGASKRGLGGANSSTHGYIFGGRLSSTYYSTIDRMVFPQQSGTLSSVGNLNASTFSVHTTNSSTYAYVDKLQMLADSRVDRIVFPFNSGTASVGGSLANSNGAYCGLNSTTHGFLCGGTTPFFSTIQRYGFPFDSGISSFIGNLSNTITYGAAMDNTDFVAQFV